MTIENEICSTCRDIVMDGFCEAILHLLQNKVTRIVLAKCDSHVIMALAQLVPVSRQHPKGDGEGQNTAKALNKLYLLHITECGIVGVRTVLGVINVYRTRSIAIPFRPHCLSS